MRPKGAQTMTKTTRNPETSVETIKRLLRTLSHDQLNDIYWEISALEPAAFVRNLRQIARRIRGPQGRVMAKKIIAGYANRSGSAGETLQ
jgi:hypothetical protein